MRAFEILVLLGVAVTAAVFDLGWGKIPNALIFAGLVPGFFYRLFTLGLWGVPVFFTGALVPVLFFAPLFFCRMIGAGDIKLLSVAGGFFGAFRVFRCILWTLFFAGVLALVRMVLYHSFRERMSFFFNYVRESVRNRKWEPYLDRVEERAKIRLCVPVLLSIIICLI